MKNFVNFIEYDWNFIFYIKYYMILLIFKKNICYVFNMYYS